MAIGQLREITLDNCMSVQVGQCLFSAHVSVFLNISLGKIRMIIDIMQQQSLEACKRFNVVHCLFQITSIIQLIIQLPHEAKGEARMEA